jgi:hypothetical protein
MIRHCKHCGELIPSEKIKLHPNTVWCTVFCRDAARDSSRMYDGVSTGTAGAISELRVACDLMARGYPVFRALSPACLCDLIVWTVAGAVRVEVRTATWTGAFNKDNKRDKGRQDTFAFVSKNKITYEPELPPCKL